MSERVLRVTGTGSVLAEPDQIELLLFLQDTETTYEKAVQMSAEQTSVLQTCITELGFQKTALKTVSFCVNTKYNDKKKLQGYQFEQQMKLEFDRDSKLLSKLLGRISESSITPKFRINYTIKDQEKVKNKLIEKAVTDSRQKAEILAAAAGVTLGDVIEVNYSWDEVQMYSKPMSRGLAIPGFFSAPQRNNQTIDGEFMLELEPEKIPLSDTVKVSWSLL